MASRPSTSTDSAGNVRESTSTNSQPGFQGSSRNYFQEPYRQDSTNLQPGVQGTSTNYFQEPYRYTSDPRTFAEDGKEYEQLVTFFVSLQALNATDEFWLISNPSNCAPFDDIIICTRIDNENVMFLFQVKTKQNSKIIADDELQRRNTSKLQIDALYEKYPKGIQEILKIIPEELIPSSLSNIKVIIFTNRPVQEKSDILELVTETNLRQFSASQGEIYKFRSEFINEHTAKDVLNSDRYALQNVFNGTTESKMGIDNTTGITATKHHTDKQVFLQSLLIYANQSDEDLNNTSICHMKDYFNSEDFIVEAIKDTYFNCIRNWCKIKSEKGSLTREYIYKLFMYSTFENFASSIDDFDEQVFQNYQEILKESFDSLWKSIKNNNLHIGFEHKNYILGMALKDFHDLETAWEEEELMAKKIKQEQMKGVCKSSGQERMKQSIVRRERQRKEYEQIICNGILKHENKKKQLQYYNGFLQGEVPLIVQNFNLNLKEKLGHLKIVFVNSDENQKNWVEIDERVRNEIQQTRVTTISHQNFKVEDIINGISSEASVSDVLNLIIDSLNLCKELLEKQNNDKEISIPRTIRRIVLNKAIFSDGKHINELFIINTNLMKNEFIAWSGVKEENILAFPNCNEIMRYLEQETFTKYKYILINEDIANITKSRSVNIHFLKCSNVKKYFGQNEIQLEWIKCNGSVDGIKQFRSKILCNEIRRIIDVPLLYNRKDCFCCMKLEEICNNIQNPFIVIEGVPGAGKTTLLKQFAQIAPSNDLVLFIALTEYYNYYEIYESVTKSVSAEDHIKNFYKDKKECKLLKDFFINKVSTKNIIILFDAFDEIAPKYTNTVSEIVKKIREANYKIIMTTRSVLKNKVEDLFETFVFSLNLFYEDDQRNYIKAYYKHREPIQSKETFLLIVWNNLSSDWFCKVPLNLYLVADVIYNDIKHGLENVDEDSYKLDQLKLYERFINDRMELYSKKINNANISKSSILNYHKYCSIKLLCNNLPIYKNIRTLLDTKLEDYFKNFKEGNDKVGILIEDVDEIIMMHRTVAEYLAAEWLLDECSAINSTNISPFSVACKLFAAQIIDIIFSDTSLEFIEHYDQGNLYVVKSFFKLMIDKSEVHKAAWEGRYKLFNQTIPTLHSVNDCNRTNRLILNLNNTIKRSR